MDEQERREALVAELVRVMNRKPKTPHEAEKRVERTAELQTQIDTLRHSGDR